MGGFTIELKSRVGDDVHCDLGNDTTRPHVGKVPPLERAANHPWNEPELNLHSHRLWASNDPMVGQYVLTGI
jgi:hypothetical protein